ncbi:alpha/beta fold hydrolase [Streptomyces spongiae]|uniref:Alpha/beta hydrolase n=1 Tax=Streptomyces spongiae TaxID=565072 RepID=A0A5N8XSM3_9ACTN|nr:alpha/beta fold hydrolase [Streptomyces spongiae]MPY62028.1 alpha/beta hydrolase [Streptomyces spongiae]
MSEPHFDVCGDGPVLLVVPGGAGHPMGLDAFVERLAERFTVVTYDPMGLAHGHLGKSFGDQRVEAWSDGARRVLDAVLPDGASAYAFGSSSGGIAVLDLLARHPERLRHVVAHEPPCVGALPDAARHLAMFREVYETYRAAGIEAAMVRLQAGLEEPSGVAADPERGRAARPPAAEADADVRPATPMGLFLTHVLRQFTAYAPDPVALRRGSGRLTLAFGHDSRGLLLHHTAESVAEAGGGALAEFPGGHIGAVTHPVEVAGRLTETLLPVG